MATCNNLLCYRLIKVFLLFGIACLATVYLFLYFNLQNNARNLLSASISDKKRNDVSFYPLPKEDTWYVKEQINTLPHTQEQAVHKFANNAMKFKSADSNFKEALPDLKTLTNVQDADKELVRKIVLNWFNDVSGHLRERFDTKEDLKINRYSPIDKYNDSHEKKAYALKDERGDEDVADDNDDEDDNDENHDKDDDDDDDDYNEDK